MKDEEEDMRLHEEFDKNFRAESLNLNLDRKFKSLKKKVEELVQPTEEELFWRFESIKKKVKK